MIYPPCKPDIAFKLKDTAERSEAMKRLDDLSELKACLFIEEFKKGMPVRFYPLAGFYYQENEKTIFSIREDLIEAQIYIAYIPEITLQEVKSSSVREIICKIEKNINPLETIKH